MVHNNSNYNMVNSYSEIIQPNNDMLGYQNHEGEEHIDDLNSLYKHQYL